VGSNLFEHAFTYVALNAATPSPITDQYLEDVNFLRAHHGLPEQQPPLAPVKSPLFQTKTQEPELRESTTKYNKIQICQWEHEFGAI
jgi:hypothetical protein